MPCCYYSYVSCLQAWKFVVTKLVAKTQLLVCDNWMIVISRVCKHICCRHPDKNSSPEANEKFIQINEAYEVLSDKGRRHNYDHGQTQDGSFTMFHKNFFTGHHRNTINTHQYRAHIIPQSYHKPFLMYFYHDFCLPCIHVSSIWDQLKKV